MESLTNPIAAKEFDKELLSYGQSVTTSDWKLTHLAASAMYECAIQKHHGGVEAQKLIAWVYSFDKRKAATLVRFFTHDHLSMNVNGGKGLPFTLRKGAEDKTFELPGGEKITLPAAFQIKWSEQRFKEARESARSLYDLCRGTSINQFKGKKVKEVVEQTQLDFETKARRLQKQIDKLEKLQVENGFTTPSDIKIFGPSIMTNKPELSIMSLVEQAEQLASQPNISDDDKRTLETVVTIIKNSVLSVQPSEDKKAA